jgi:hypothetical protein
VADLAALIRVKLGGMIEDPGKPYQSCAGCEYDCNCQAYIGYQTAILAVLDAAAVPADELSTDWRRGYRCALEHTVRAVAAALGIEATSE